MLGKLWEKKLSLYGFIKICTYVIKKIIALIKLGYQYTFFIKYNPVKIWFANETDGYTSKRSVGIKIINNNR